MKVFFIFFTCLMILHQSSGQTFEGNGYKDVVVSISPDVSPDKQQDVVDNLKKWISAGSRSLYIATKRYAYINSVTILLPTSWTEVPADPSSGISYDDGVIHVDKPNPQHGDGPYTQQTGSCGERGEFIHVTPDFITNLETTSTQMFGPTDKLFVNQWAQLRYGVFDEHGYPGDPQFPIFYYEQSYVDGELVTTLTPNFCTDSPLYGHRMDFVDGGSCQLDPVTNLPDENCVFVPDGDNTKIRSSLMSLTSLENLDQFCTDAETSFAHNPYRPNKQNKICDHKSTWSVISANLDFVGVTPMDAENPPETMFKILRPQEERFVFVLDVSGSMADADRIGRLIQSSNRWVKYEVRDGSQVGVTSFSSNANTVQQLTAITNDAVRDDITRKIDTLRANGGTCLGAGLKNGMNVLNGVGDTSSGGVILFVTDGMQDCDGPDKTTLTDPALLQRVKDSKVRIITIAFGTSTDPNLENLAIISGGKVYFVPDGTGIEDINNAFDGSLTFQPAVPSGEVDIIVFSETFKNIVATQSGTFVIDGSLGRDAKFQMDFIVGAATDIQSVDIRFPNSSIVSFPFDSTFKSPFLAKFAYLETGTYNFDVVPAPGKTIPYINVVISAKAASGDTLPFYTRCWLSSGNTEVDLSTTKLSILAEVKQGNRAVFNAKVQAFIESGDQPQPITLDLFDNGSGSDLIANDGIYSRFFVKYDGKNGDYTLRCQVKGDENTNFVAQNQEEYYDKMQSLAMRSSRSYPVEFGPTSPICCGSNGDSPFLKKEPTGNFERKVTGTSFKLKNVPTSDTYPPIKVADFKAEVSQTGINISFTAPGDDFDEGTAAQYDIRYSTKFNDFLDETLWSSLPQITVNDVISGSLSPLPAGDFVNFEVSRDLFTAEDVFYLAMRALDENLSSPTSSPYQLVVDIYPPNRVDTFTAKLNTATVTISFTAPGDDPNKGTASYYDIRFTNNEADFSDETLWDGLRKISAEDVISGSMNPVEAGTTVAFEVFIDMFAPDDIIFLSMRSCDNLNQTSEISKPFKLILDIIPPADVMDMVATLYDSNVEITFTAPGDDKENGTASFYDVRYTFNLTEFFVDSFWEEIPKISKADLVSGSFDPVESGTPVTFAVSRNLFNKSEIYYLSMRSYDSVNNESPISDPIELDLGSGAAATGSFIGLLVGVLMVLCRF